MSISPSPLPTSAPVKIGELVIPFNSQLERVAAALVQELIPNKVMLSAALERFGITPNKHPAQLDALFTQLLLVPRRLTDRSYPAEVAARKRVDAGERLSEEFSDLPYTPSTETRCAATWVALYLARSGDQFDKHRIRFLEERFGREEGVATTLTKVVKKEMPYTLESLGDALKDSVLVLPSIDSGISWRSLVEEDSNKSSPQPIGHTGSPNENHSRMDLYRAISNELRNEATLIENSSRYQDFEICPETELSEVRKRRELLFTAHGSVILEKFSRILWDRGRSTDVIPEEFHDPGISRSFIIQIPTALSVQTKSFGVIQVENFGSGVMYTLEGETKPNHKFKIFDTESPFSWQSVIEKYT